VYSQPLNFTTVLTKFHVFMACLFTACNFGPSLRRRTEKELKKGWHRYPLKNLCRTSCPG
jgi:hypothetical protein